MQLSLVHPDSAPLPKLNNDSLNDSLVMPVLKRYNRFYSDDTSEDNIFYLNIPQIKKHTNIDEIYLLYKICYNSLSIKDFKFLIKFCNDLQKDILDNRNIIITGPKNNYVYKFIYNNLTDPNINLPVMMLNEELGIHYIDNSIHLKTF